MPKKIDLLGFEFSGSLVLSECENISGRRAYLCRCSCGKEFKASVKNIRNGGTRSCGCLRQGVNKTHGLSRAKSYRSWANMIQRCTNANTGNYKNYGGRGISVCDDWFSFECFHDDMGDPPSRNHSIGRIDNNGDYKKENCRWETTMQQAQNTTRTVKFRYRGFALTAREVCCINGLDYDLVYERLRSSCSDDEVDQSSSRRHVFVLVGGVSMNVTDAMKNLDIPVSTFYKRRRRGLSPQEIINKKINKGYV